MLQTTGSKYVKVMMPDGFLLTALGTSHYTFSRHLTNQFGPVGLTHLLV